MSLSELKITDEYIEVKESELLHSVTQKLLESNSKLAIVLDGGELKGIIGLNQLLDALANGLDPKTAKAEEIMAPPADSVELSDSVESVISKLLYLKVIALPVLDEGKFKGIVFLHDIAHYLLSLE